MYIRQIRSLHGLSFILSMISIEDTCYKIVSDTEAHLKESFSMFETFVVPEFIEYQGKKLNITNIMEYSFNPIKSKYIIFSPNSHVETIEHFAFAGMNLISVTLPKSLKSYVRVPYDYLVQYELYGGDSEYFTELDSGTIIQKHPFLFLRASRKRNRIMIRETTKRILSYSFTHHTLTSIHIPSSVISIDKGAFFNCKNMIRLSFSPDSKLEIIEETAFEYCGIKKVRFPSSLMIIGQESFNNCPLEIIKFPLEGKLDFIGACAFKESKIRKIEFPKSLKILSQGAFNKSLNLNEIVFHEDSELEVIFNKTFSECDNIVHVKYPESIRNVILN